MIYKVLNIYIYVYVSHRRKLISHKCCCCTSRHNFSHSESSKTFFSFLPIRIQKVAVNLEPNDKDHQVIPHLWSMHKAEGCKCAVSVHSNMRINHYLGSRGDYFDKLSRYWTVSHTHSAAGSLCEHSLASSRYERSQAYLPSCVVQR